MQETNSFDDAFSLFVTQYSGVTLPLPLSLRLRRLGRLLQRQRLLMVKVQPPMHDALDISDEQIIQHNDYTPISPFHHIQTFNKENY